MSYTMLTKRLNNHTACTDEQTILNYSSVIAQKLNALKEKHATSKEQKPTFKPSINKNSALLDSQKNALSPELKLTRHMKLYNDQHKQKIALTNLTNQIYNKNMMFKPHINKDYIFPGHEKPFEERQKYYEEKSKEKKEKTIQEIKLSENTSFRPAVNKSATLNTWKDNDYKTVFEQLYAKGKLYERMKQEKINTLYNIQRKPVLNKKSNLSRFNFIKFVLKQIVLKI